MQFVNVFTTIVYTPKHWPTPDHACAGRCNICLTLYIIALTVLCGVIHCRRASLSQFRRSAETQPQFTEEKRRRAIERSEIDAWFVSDGPPGAVLTCKDFESRQTHTKILAKNDCGGPTRSCSGGEPVE